MKDRRERRDYYYKKAKIEGYRSRAAYKLKEIFKRFKVVKKGFIVIDLGAAPGGWLQVAREFVGEKGFVLGVDLAPIKPFSWKNVKTMQLDITSEEAINVIKESLPKNYADLVISDLAPKVSGVWSLDHFRQIFLAEKALEIAEKILRPGGNIVIKVFQGELLPDFIRKVKKLFRKVKLVKPKASRKHSAEIYVIGLDKLE